VRKFKLKVCGLRDNAREVIEEIQPDFAGFIFYEKSPRFIGVVKPTDLPKDVKKVGVFVNAQYESISAAIEKFGLDVVQLHGEETPELCLRLKSHAQVIKVLAGNYTINPQELKSYEPFIDYFLFDTRTKTYGGTGVTFDWNQLEKIKTKVPVFVSGGLGLEEVKKLQAMTHLNIYGIDVNSKFENAPGHKDIKLLNKLKAIIK